MKRRDFLKSTAVAGAGLFSTPYLNCGNLGVSRPMKRNLGRIGFETTTLGLGGQASIQWTPEDVDPVKIILKAFHLGINYFDTSNLYGPSQSNYGKAFRQLGLVPGMANYNESLRRSIFLTSKTHLRWAKGLSEIEGVNNWSNGQHTSAVDDLKRSLSQIFGDGQDQYPEEAYLDMVLIHNVSSMADIDCVYKGLNNPDPKSESIGTLAALRDYRDGTNRTGLNPNEEKRIRHIGFSSHYSPAVMIEMIQRDTENILDGLLVAINPNDKLQFNMQHNVIPVAQAKNMGIIGMKVFADGAMYDKDPHWSRQPEHVVRRIGTEKLPSRPLVEYSLSISGVHTAIIGIGETSDDPNLCQLTQNLSAAQIRPTGLSDTQMQEIEAMTAPVKNGKTNYFQDQAQGLTPVQNAEICRVKNDPKKLKLIFHMAFAGNEPIDRYDIYRENEKIGVVPHKPQITKTPFEFVDEVTEDSKYNYQIITVDQSGNKATQDLALSD